MHLHGPRVMHGAKTPAEFAALQRGCVAALRDRFNDGRDVHDARHTVAAYVSQGRWVVLCPECYSGAAVDVEHGEARCFECGAVYQASTDTLRLPSPASLAAIDTILGARPDLRTRNWQPGETLRALKTENRQHGVRSAAAKGRE